MIVSISFILLLTKTRATVTFLSFSIDFLKIKFGGQGILLQVKMDFHFLYSLNH